MVITDDIVFKFDHIQIMKKKQQKYDNKFTFNIWRDFRDRYKDLKKGGSPSY